MFIKQEDIEKLKVKNADSVYTMFSTINKFMVESERKVSCAGCGWDYSKMEKNNKKIDPLVYAQKIDISASGNEPKVYARVYDNDGKEVYYCSYLSDKPEAYGIVAEVAALFLDTFNKYMYCNFD